MGCVSEFINNLTPESIKFTEKFNNFIDIYFRVQSSFSPKLLILLLVVLTILIILFKVNYEFSILIYKRYREYILNNIKYPSNNQKEFKNLKQDEKRRKLTNLALLILFKKKKKKKIL